MAMMLSLLGLHSLRIIPGFSEANFHPGSCYTRMQPSSGLYLLYLYK